MTDSSATDSACGGPANDEPSTPWPTTWQRKTIRPSRRLVSRATSHFCSVPVELNKLGQRQAGLELGSDSISHGSDDWYSAFTSLGPQKGCLRTCC